ncbi:hypothetical protein chiPu_0027498, partial [Chiloscyllium punctatum]|nr:hypothetical protein [Chiloscyllium punctatum]
VPPGSVAAEEGAAGSPAPAGCDPLPAAPGRRRCQDSGVSLQQHPLQPNGSADPQQLPQAAVPGPDTDSSYRLSV